MHVLCTGAGNKKMLSFCCTPLKATLHTIAAKSLPNWIIQSSPIAVVVLLPLSNNQISEEARRVVLSETLSSCIARRLFSLKTILLIKRGVSAEQGSEEHRLLVLFVCSLLKAWSKTVVVGLRGTCSLLLPQHVFASMKYSARIQARLMLPSLWIRCNNGCTFTHVESDYMRITPSLFTSPRPSAK